MSVYYNEHDPFAATWLRELIKGKHIPAGEVDERDIQAVTPADVSGFTTCHFFAGIGGWAEALRLAEWPQDRPIWTGSCPCQPFSAAGKGLGEADPRHLWPVWFWLIRECRPDLVVGEQVANAIGHGWLDFVCADLEEEGYACGAIVLGAHSVGAPHRRQRLWWVADRDSKGRCQLGSEELSADGNPSQRDHADGCRETRALAHAGGAGLQGGAGALLRGTRRREEGGGAPRPSAWAGASWLRCRDGTHRPVEPGTFPLAHGVPTHVGRLRGYGNAIVPQVAAAFIRAYLSLG